MEFVPGGSHTSGDHPLCEKLAQAEYLKAQGREALLPLDHVLFCDRALRQSRSLGSVRKVTVCGGNTYRPDSPGIDSFSGKQAIDGTGPMPMRTCRLSVRLCTLVPLACFALPTVPLGNQRAGNVR